MFPCIFSHLELTFTPHYIITDKGLLSEYIHALMHMYLPTRIDTNKHTRSVTYNTELIRMHTYIVHHSDTHTCSDAHTIIPKPHVHACTPHSDTHRLKLAMTQVHTCSDNTHSLLPVHAHTHTCTYSDTYVYKHKLT